MRKKLKSNSVIGFLFLLLYSCRIGETECPEISVNQSSYYCEILGSPSDLKVDSVRIYNEYIYSYLETIMSGKNKVDLSILKDQKEIRKAILQIFVSNRQSLEKYYYSCYFFPNEGLKVISCEKDPLP